MNPCRCCSRAFWRSLAPLSGSLSHRLQPPSLPRFFSAPPLPPSSPTPFSPTTPSQPSSPAFITKPLDAEDNSSRLPIDYSSLLDEKEFHRLADDVLHHIQGKIDEAGEELDIDGFDVDYAQGVLTIKLGTLGTYVINKQTPNRQIWFSSPVSGPARFDWDAKDHRWVYRRTRYELLGMLENEFNKLLGTSITLSNFGEQ